MSSKNFLIFYENKQRPLKGEEAMHVYLSEGSWPLSWYLAEIPRQENRLWEALGTCCLEWEALEWTKQIEMVHHV